MISIIKGADFTVILSIVSCMIVAATMVVYEVKLNEKLVSRTEKSLFMAICGNILVINMMFAFNYYLRSLNNPLWGRTGALVTNTIKEIARLNLVYQWLLFVDYKLYFSRDHLFRKYKVYYIPIVILFVLLIINMFTGIMFDVGPLYEINESLVYNLMEVIEYLYFFGAFLEIAKYRRNNPGPYFFTIRLMVIPIALAEFFSQISSFWISSISYAVTVVCLFISMMRMQRIRDGQTGFYNGEYLKYMEQYEAKGKRKFSGRLEFKTTNDMEFARILKDNLPANSDIIHLDKGSFLFLSENGKKSFLDMVNMSIEEAVNDYDLEHPDAEPLLIR